MELSIIIVNYNCERLLGRCLNSIFVFAPGLEYEVIVVDNASEHFEEIPKRFPQVKVIRNAVNAGFARANNQGLKAACGRFVLFLNPDTEITKGSLEGMVKYLKVNPGTGVLGPKLVYPDGALQFSCRKFYTVRAILLRRFPFLKLFFGSRALKEHLMSEWDHNVPRDVDWVLAACLMAPRSILLEAGGFDEKYRLYFEDVDLCYRMKQKGLRVMYYPDSIIIHHHRRDSARFLSPKAVPHIISALRFFSKFGWSF